MSFFGMKWVKQATNHHQKQPFDVAHIRWSYQKLNLPPGSLSVIVTTRASSVPINSDTVVVKEEARQQRGDGQRDRHGHPRASTAATCSTTAAATAAITTAHATTATPAAAITITTAAAAATPPPLPPPPPTTTTTTTTTIVTTI